MKKNILFKETQISRKNHEHLSAAYSNICICFCQQNFFTFLIIIQMLKNRREATVFLNLHIHP